MSRRISSEQQKVDRDKFNREFDRIFGVKPEKKNFEKPLPANRMKEKKNG